MTSPLLSTILAVLCACLGYAAGRVHQWHRAETDRDADREDAYREGYDEATRSTLSMAARIAGPATAASSPGPSPSPSSTAPSPSSTGSSHPSTGSSHSNAGPSPSSTGLSHSSTGPSPSSAEPSRSSTPGENAATSTAPSSAAAATAEKRPLIRPESLGESFPAPTPYAIPRQSTDDRTQPGARDGNQEEPQAQSPAGAFFEPVAQDSASPGDELPVPRLGRRGRHYVPDELIQAATYRLPADRVARAKVPGTVTPPEGIDTGRETDRDKGSDLTRS